MDLAILSEYDRTRDFRDKSFRALCYAPYVSMYLDTLGFVRVCCQNTKYTIGNIQRSSIDEIWHGARNRALRQAMIDNNLKLGCEFCEWQLSDKNLGSLFAKEFEPFPVSSKEPQWPKQIEFSISNTCNLACVMCKGDWSSTIRSKREKLPPLPKVYNEAFFSDIRKYLPHLQRARFLGGEPFLAHESLRILEMFVEDRLPTACHITTNGTQLNEKVRRILDALPVSIAVSMDGVTKQTVESVRLNADFAALMANIRWFRDYTRQRQTVFGLTYCLMRQNWHELGSYLLLADEWDCDVEINTVFGPPHCSLYTLSREELGQVVSALEAEDSRIGHRLTRNLRLWNLTLDRLRHRLESGTEIAVKPKLLNEGSQPAGPEDKLLHQAEQTLAKWGSESSVDRLVCDRDEIILEVVSRNDGGFLGVSPDRLLGQPIRIVHEQLLHLLGDTYEEIEVDESQGWQDRLVRYSSAETPATIVRAIAFRSQDGRMHLLACRGVC